MEASAQAKLLKPVAALFERQIEGEFLIFNAFSSYYNLTRDVPESIKFCNVTSRLHDWNVTFTVEIMFIFSYRDGINHKPIKKSFKNGKWYNSSYTSYGNRINKIFF